MPRTSKHAKFVDSSLLNTLEVAHDLAVKGVRSIRISGDPTSHFAAMLYLEIIEFAGSLILLRRYSRVAGYNFARSASAAGAVWNLPTAVEVGELFDQPTTLSP
jgi:hypothetical protein